MKNSVVTTESAARCDEGGLETRVCGDGIVPGTGGIGLHGSAIPEDGALKRSPRRQCKIHSIAGFKITRIPARDKRFSSLEKRLSNLIDIWAASAADCLRLLSGKAGKGTP